MKMATLLCTTALAAGPALALRFVDAPQDFGSVQTGQSSLRTVRLVNDEDRVLALDEIVAAGAGLAVTPASAILNPGDSLSLQLAFAPAANLPHGGAVVCSGDFGAEGLAWSGAGDLPGSDWDGSYGLSGDALVAWLAAAVDGQTSLGYDGARAALFGDLHNVDGWVEGVYTGFMVQTWGIPDPNVMNTEHTWPQSYGAEGDARADLHHLYPVSSWVNSSRGNLPYGDVVSSSSGYPLGGADRGVDAQGWTVFEPRLQHKGDCARAVFYFALRYGNREGFLNLAGQEAVLRAWNDLDPPDAWERTRQDGVEALQHNRNPFIDAPELLDRIVTLDGGPADPPTAAAPALWPASLHLDGEHEGSILLANEGDAPLSIYFAALADPLATVDAPPAQLAPGAWTRLAVHAQPGAVGTTSWSVETSAGVLSLPVDVSAPGGEPPLLTARMEGSLLRLEWDAVAGFDLYRVEMGLTPQGPWWPMAFSPETTLVLDPATLPDRGFFRAIAAGGR